MATAAPRASAVAQAALAAVLATAGAGWLACSTGVRSTETPETQDLAVEPNATVLGVADGDTLRVAVGDHEERVRLIGIDTPESVAPNQPVECYGKEAAERMAALVPPGTPIRLERDIEARDLYGRLLAYVYRASDGLHLNLDQVRQGYAEALPYPPNTALEHSFTDAERQARANRAGLWNACGT